MCVEVFEHLPEPIKAVEEFARLFKPGGYLILTAPFCSLTHFAPLSFLYWLQSLFL
jgi:2-polyprenyl-3-methyl-5-hydroxy-6-metoxy-1,4-benzoquinol methylase